MNIFDEDMAKCQISLAKRWYRHGNNDKALENLLDAKSSLAKVPEEYRSKDTYVSLTEQYNDLAERLQIPELDGTDSK